MKKQFEERNLTMFMDLYELTMAYGYFKSNRKEEKVAFEVFYRQNPDGGGFAVFAGLNEIIEYLKNIKFRKEDIDYIRTLNLFEEDFFEYLKTFKFTGQLYSLQEGTVMYPNTPIMTIIAPIIEAQIIETAILTQINHQSLIATKARRIKKAAEGRLVCDFGARRAHNIDAAVYGSKAARIGGFDSTATVLAGQMFNMPLFGTHAHSWIMSFPSEFEAFATYAKIYPDACALLVDTYDVLNSGIHNAIRVAKEILIPMGKRLKSIRLDSGDLAYLSKKVRKMLDDAGLNDCKIVVSNSLDEYTISSLLSQGAPIDIFGVGERMITAKSEPVFGAVYKVCAVEKNGEMIPKIKVSENSSKTTNPGLKMLWRIYNEEHQSIADLLTLWEENPDVLENYRFIDPEKPWKRQEYTHCIAKPMLELIIDNGLVVTTLNSIETSRNYLNAQLSNEVWEEEQRFENPHKHYIDFSPKLWELKQNLINEYRA